MEWKAFKMMIETWSKDYDVAGNKADPEIDVHLFQNVTQYMLMSRGSRLYYA